MFIIDSLMTFQNDNLTLGPDAGTLERVISAWLDVEDLICEEYQSGPYNPVAPPTPRTIFPNPASTSRMLV